MIKFRPLKAEEVECRIGQTIQRNDTTSVVLLLYKNARCDMNILDETVGADRWQREHYECKSNLFCRIGINVADDGADPWWVWKSDCGTESNSESEKGEASDSFKRAAFNWGIGRELYTAPFIFIPQISKADGKENFKLDTKGKPTGRFTVTQMSVEDGKITSLNIENQALRRTVYTFGQVLKDPAPIKEILCPKCGRAVKPMGNGTQKYTPQQVLDNLGMCFSCYRQREQGNERV